MEKKHVWVYIMPRFLSYNTKSMKLSLSVSLCLILTQIIPHQNIKFILLKDSVKKIKKTKSGRKYLKNTL